MSGHEPIINELIDDLIDSLEDFLSTVESLAKFVDVADGLRDIDAVGAADFLLLVVRDDIDTALPQDLVNMLERFQDDDYLGPVIAPILDRQAALAG